MFRRILATGASLDQIEIACSSDAHVALIWEKALRHNWPVTLASGIPAAFTRPGRALIGLCDWIETDFSAGHFRRLLQSGDLGVEEEDEGFTAGQAARLLARAQAGWGRATYGLALGRLHKSYESRAADRTRRMTTAPMRRPRPNRRPAFATGSSAWWTSVPEPADGRHGCSPDGGQRRARLSSTVTPHAAARSTIEPRRRLQEHIGELRALGAFACGLAASLRFIRERVQSLHVAARAAAARTSLRVHPLPIRLRRPPPPLRRRSRRRPRVLVVDRRRRAARRRARRHFGRPAPVDRQGRRSRVCGADPARRIRTASVTFSYSCRDTREFRETYASWLMLQAFRLQQRRRGAVLSADEGGARRAEVGSAGGPRDRALHRRMVAAQRRRHRRRRRRGP